MLHACNQRLFYSFVEAMTFLNTIRSRITRRRLCDIPELRDGNHEAEVGNLPTNWNVS
jgi:hypothetical protein